jgi:multicomponent Na+:H+ antiporter subunit G
MLEIIAYWTIGVGLAFDLLGCIGLVRLPDVYNRAQAATKCVTLGTCFVLLGTALFGAAGGNWGMFIKAVICAGFVLLTSPVGAHAVCRGAYVSGVPLADVSVEDRFVHRAEEIRKEQDSSAGEVQREETEAPRT